MSYGDYKSSFDYSADDYFNAAPKPAAAKTAVAKTSSFATTFGLAEPKPEQPVALIPPSALKQAPKSTEKADTGGYDLEIRDYFTEGKKQVAKTSGIEAQMAKPSAISKVVNEQMQKGGALSLTAITDLQAISKTVQSKWIADIDKTRLSIDEKIAEYGRRTSEANNTLADYAKAEAERLKDPNYKVDDDVKAKALHLVALTAKVNEVFFNSAKQFIELIGLKRVEMVAQYTGLIAFVFDEKVKEIELLNKMLATAKDAEKHELDRFVGYQKAFLEEEASRMGMLVNYIKLAAELQEKAFNQNMTIDEAEFNHLVKTETLLVERFKAQGEHDLTLTKLRNDKELALKDLENSQLVAEWNKDLNLRTLELQDGQVKMQLGSEERIQLAAVAARQAVAQMHADVEIRRVDAEKEVGLKTVEMEGTTRLAETRGKVEIAVKKYDAKQVIQVQRSKDQAQIEREREATKRHDASVKGAVALAKPSCTIS